MALKNASDLYEMELHEIRLLVGGSIEVVRVPGGWLYNTLTAETGYVVASAFVPFDNEFQSPVPR
jgi:hypothetical protein